MKDTFNINRFWLLVRRQWGENKKYYILLWGVISLSLLVFSLAYNNEDYLVAIYFWVFCIGGCAMVPRLFSKWSDSCRSSFYLLLPASTTEKFLCGIFYALILFIPVYALNFLIIKYIVSYVVIMPFPNNLSPFSWVLKKGISEVFNTPYTFYIFPLLTLLFAQSLLMIIVLRFKKQHTLIFVLVCLVIMVAYNIIMKPIMSDFGKIPPGTIFTPGLLIPHFNLGFGLLYKTGSSSFLENFYFIRLIRNLNYLVWLVIFLMLYLSAGYKLKEREL
jgi:hypothetical protein